MVLRTMQPILLLLGLASASSFRQIVAFGDSITDTGNLYKLTAGENPSRQEYYNGRFSNGPTWIEYFTKLLKTSLVDLSYGGATTDLDSDRGSGVPGCVQQADAFARSGKRATVANSTLATVVFQGNDFFAATATAQGYMRNMDRCLHKILAVGFKHVLISTSNAPELTPAFPLTPALQRNRFARNTDQLPGLWRNEIQALAKEFAGVTIYTMDLKGKHADPT